ncbi:MAG: DUF3253 domain-containing protein [Pseudomonadota bacterium]
MTDDEIAQTLSALAATRGPDRSFCPSEAARALAEDWRPLMPRIRAVAATLARGGRLRVTQSGIEVDALAAVGPIRLAAAGADRVAAGGAILHPAGGPR